MPMIGAGAAGGGVNDLGALGAGALGDASREGLFSLRGSPLLMAMRRRAALRNARNRMRQGSSVARLAGLDPAGQRQAFVDLNRDVSGQTADFLNQGQEQDIQGSADFLRGLYGQERGYQAQAQEADRQRRQQKRDFWGNVIGTGVGAGLSALL